MKRLIVVALALLITTPAFACGPTGGGGGGGGKQKGQNASPRQKWTKKRMKEIKPGLDQYESGQRTAGRIDQILDGIDGKTSNVAAAEAHNQMPRAIRVRKPQSAEEKKYMFHRFEFLALKKERKGLTANEAAEMFALRYVLTNSGDQGARHYDALMAW